MDSAELLDILGNENRRRILRLLSRRPCYVTEISEYLGVSPKAVIDHLRKLEDAGLIESRTDDQRRKYFSISRNLRLEVNVSPYEFGMKSAYPASTNLDVSRWRYLSLNVQFDTDEARDDARGDDGATGNADPEAPGEDRTVERATDLAAELDELQQLQRELSLAQRWVHGRIADVQNRLDDALNGEDESRLSAEVLSAIAGSAATVGEISRAVDAPEHVVENCLSKLADTGFVARDESGEWVLAE
jgi:ArsR family transcriptional regulator